jgi:hypothetical protein
VAAARDRDDVALSRLRRRRRRRRIVAGGTAGAGAAGNPLQKSHTHVTSRGSAATGAPETWRGDPWRGQASWFARLAQVLGAVAQSGSAPRSHRGGQGFKSPQLHRVLAGQRPISCLSASTDPIRVRFWERFGSGSCLAGRLAWPTGRRKQARSSVARAGLDHGVRFPSALAMLP